MTNFMSQGPEPLFDEVAIADLGHFQIAVLTTSVIVKRCVFFSQKFSAKRLYQTQGWLVFDHQIVAHFDELKIGSIFAKKSPFRSVQRLAPAIPISFEINSTQPLPIQVCAQAAFVCELPKTDFPYYSVFCHILPRFVRIYSFGTSSFLLAQVEQMLKDEEQFVAQNYAQLKRVPFYQHSFGL
ncbi:MAG: hypothetical protein AAFX95_05000 [Cyanobacteria bacterium J06639_16]